MKANLHYTHESRQDLDDIWDYIAVELSNPIAAARTVDKIMDAIDQLEIFPEMGSPLRAITHTKSDLRFLVCGNYLAFYRVREQDVYIDRILYGRRDYLSTLFGDPPMTR